MVRIRSKFTGDTITHVLKKGKEYDVDEHVAQSLVKEDKAELIDGEQAVEKRVKTVTTRTVKPDDK
jgi:hypothetical protein